MYENRVTNRPPGANSVEMQLLISIFTRDWQVDSVKNPELKYDNYIFERFCLMYNQPDPSLNDKLSKEEVDALNKMRANMKTVVDIEIQNAKLLKFVNPNNTLSWKGIMFVHMAMNGGYGYVLPKFDNIFMLYSMILTQIPDQYTQVGQEDEECDCDECNLSPEEFTKLLIKASQKKEGKVAKLKRLFGRS
ncbi:MAG: hypothetical protein R2685_10600 [Candidatus Nitrosocosmicus sp.]|nr:hypothetical protein [Candidatus Nitrosocosmicus sp.]